MIVKPRIVHNFPLRRSNIFQTFQQMKFVAREESQKFAELVMGICSDDLLRKKNLFSLAIAQRDLRRRL